MFKQQKNCFFPTITLLRYNKMLKKFIVVVKIYVGIL